MNEKNYSQRLEKVLAHANVQAQKYGHRHLEPEHLLIGLLKEGSGYGANALANLGMDFRKCRIETEKLMRPSGQYMTGHAQLSEQAQHTLEEAANYATTLGSRTIGTGHLGYALTNEQEDTVTSIVLKGLGVTTERYESELKKLIEETT